MDEKCFIFKAILAIRDSDSYFQILGAVLIYFLSCLGAVSVGIIFWIEVICGAPQ